MPKVLYSQCNSTPSQAGFRQAAYRRFLIPGGELENSSVLVFIALINNRDDSEVWLLPVLSRCGMGYQPMKTRPRWPCQRLGLFGFVFSPAKIAKSHVFTCHKRAYIILPILKLSSFCIFFCLLYFAFCRYELVSFFKLFLLWPSQYRPIPNGASG